MSPFVLHKRFVHYEVIHELPLAYKE